MDNPVHPTVLRHGATAMDDTDADELEWRDTYFVLFQQSRRPTLTQRDGRDGPAGPAPVVVRNGINP